MIYLDYSATTKASKNVVDRFVYVAEKFYANPNSIHKVGVDSKNIIDESIKSISNMLGIKENEFIFTSGASESNNTILKGIEASHIITTKLEHSSINTPVGFLQTKGIRISFVNLDENGLVDLNHLQKLITNEDTLISIGMVNSEIGIRQNIEEIGKILKKYPNVVFHSDITQALGKTKFDLENVDLASFSFHKIYGFKGIGGLIKKNGIRFVPLIHGGKAVSVYRSGTPQTALIASSEEALSSVMEKIDEKISYVKELNDYLKTKIANLVVINSNNNCIPHILNFSVKDKNSEDTLKFFSDNDIFISSKTACSSGNYSLAINELYDMDRAISSVRISLSHFTTKEEIDIFVDKLKEYVK